MKIILLLTASVAVVLAIPHSITLKEEWNEYKKSFGKFYTSEEEDIRRLNAYLETRQLVEEHNRKYERGESSFTMGINKFADWFPEERDRLNGLKVNPDVLSENRKAVELAAGTKVPDKINWVKKGAVTSVKDQGLCGSCYAFSAVGALEGLMYITNKTITDLSVQELVDCSRMQGNEGCNGGYMEQCFQYVEDKDEISTNKSYPYEAEDKNGCRAKNGKFGATCTEHVTLPKNEFSLKVAVGTIGPVSIGFAVTNEFLSYFDGIYDGKCNKYINHGMLAVGYGTDNETKKDYWLVKNSWGENWGMNGYVKIHRGVNKCGIDLINSYPLYKKRNGE